MGVVRKQDEAITSEQMMALLELGEHLWNGVEERRRKPTRWRSL